MFPISASKLSKFIAFLVAKHYKSSSIQSILSGLSYIHALNDRPNPVSHCLIKKMLLGSKWVSLTPDPRLPITQKILRSIMKNASRLFPSVFEQTLFRAMYSVAFHALLRIGVYTVTYTSAHIIQFKAITFQVKGRSILSCTINLLHYKHSFKPATLNIPKSRVSAICPVVYLVRYCNLRGAKDCPLFLTENGTAVKSRHFS